MYVYNGLSIIYDHAEVCLYVCLSVIVSHSYAPVCLLVSS
jgi:hypothetical protein